MSHFKAEMHQIRFLASFCLFVRLHLKWSLTPWPWSIPQLYPIITRGVPNSGFRLFDRISIVLWTIRPNKNTNSVAVLAEHFDAAPAVLIFTTSLCSSLIMAVTACCLLSSHDPLPFVRLPVWARAASTNWVKSAVDVTSCTINAWTNYSYLFGWHYSSEYEYTIRSTIWHRSEYKANIRYIPNDKWHKIRLIQKHITAQRNILAGNTDVQSMMMQQQNICTDQVGNGNRNKRKQYNIELYECLEIRRTHNNI